MNTLSAQVATQDLIHVFQAEIGGVMTNACDARTLHKFLEVARDFSTWIKDRIAEYGFTIEQDYTCIESLSSPKSGSTKARPQKLIDYHLALDMGKELSMVEKNDKGREARKYFINCERLAIEALSKTQYGLKAIPPSPYISEAQAQQFKRSMEAHCKSNGATYPLLYRKVYDHFGVTSYKNIPCGKLEEAARLIGIKLVAAQKTAMPPEPFKLSFTPEELEDLVAERIKALPAPASLEGDVMPKASKNTLSVDLSMMDGLRKITFDFKTNAYQNGRWAMWQSDGNFSIRVMDDDEFLISSQQLPKYIADSMGGMIKRDHLPSIIEVAAVRLKN